jgi:curved DNA-binding protein CbpA
MSYFVDMTTVAEARERYRSLAKTHHPDAGGDTNTLQAINAE